MADALLFDLFRAYYDARKNKRNTINQLRFEMDLEHNLIALAREIRGGTYCVSKSVGFIIHNPVQREIFAAEFRDRVVHHLVVNDIEGIVERSLITDCYSCRKGYGTSYGVDRLKHHIRSCSDNYTHKAYVLKMDIQGYFMSINRALLFDKMEVLLQRYAHRKSPNGKRWKEVVDMERTCYLLREIIFNDPTQNCRLKGWPEEWEGLPPSKSLLSSRVGYGLPIGNLTSQIFSNIYLTDFDQYVKRTLGMKHYGRYVDDFYVVHRDKEVLKRVRNTIDLYLRNEVQLTPYPHKTVIQTVHKGIDFLGVHVKPHRDYLLTRTQRKMCRTVNELDRTFNKDSDMHHALSCLNSCLGYMKQCKTYGIRQKMVHRALVIGRYMTITSGYEKFKLLKSTVSTVHETSSCTPFSTGAFVEV